MDTTDNAGNGPQRQRNPGPSRPGVHTAYDEDVNSHIVALIEKLNTRLESGALKKPAAVASGHAAAVAVVELMDQTFHDLKPAAIIKAFNADADLWVKFGDKTVDLMAQGALTLAMLWESAWKQGHGKTKISNADLGPVDEKELAKLYLDPDFVPSKTLDQIGDLPSSRWPAPRSARRGAAEFLTTVPQSAFEWSLPCACSAWNSLR